MKHLATAIAFLLSSIAFAQTKQIRTVGDFTGISSASGIAVEVTQGTENAVLVYASNDEYLEKLKTEVDKNGVLKIFMEYKKGMGWNNKNNVKLAAYVTYKSINKLTAGSGSSIITKNTVKADLLAIEVSSGATLDADIETKDGNIIVVSGASTKLKGTATNMVIEASSGSTLKAADLQTETCNVTASSGAEIKIGVSKKLKATASSGGSIRYKGNCEVEKKTESSGGTIKKM